MPEVERRLGSSAKELKSQLAEQKGKRWYIKTEGKKYQEMGAYASY